MLKTDFIQTYLARAYLQSWASKAEMDDDYWRRWALSDTAVVIFFGPLMFLLFVAMFSGVHFPTGTKAYTALTLVMGASAFALAAAASKSGRWRQLLEVERRNSRRQFQQIRTKIVSGIVWAGVSPLVSYFVFGVVLKAPFKS